MKVTVSGRQMDVGEALTTHITSELTAAVAKYFANALEASVTVSRQGHLCVCDINVHVGRGIDAVGSASAADPYPACDTAIEHVAKRLRRHKRRLVDQQRSPAPEAVAVPAAVLSVAEEEPEQTADGDAPMIIAELTHDLLTLSVGEAVMRLDLAQKPALLFKNAAHGGLNLVYRRNDGHIGWIDPTGNSPLGEGVASQRRVTGAAGN
ncbi:MAG: ribosome-associated translation inhibitor RaiA [Alphaproteobacteria bacterium]|nr:ribosome-associated translation inhibitor RaiA [Alphaproteobacteria bacterium]TAD89383.1 MAG: ribosome-associated translation inhibitor RaiA [Alphaproteobacteria bacterium]